MFIPDPTFFHPGSRIRTVSIPEPGSSSKNLSILTPKKAKKWFLSSKKYDPGCSSRIPDPDADFLPSRIPGSKRHPISDPDPQHWISDSRFNNKTARGGIYCITSFFAINFTELKIILFLNILQKMLKALSNMGWDAGSEIHPEKNLFRILDTDSGVKKHLIPGPATLIFKSPSPQPPAISGSITDIW